MEPDHIELVFLDYDNKVRWNLGKMDEIDFGVMEKEIQVYNNWIGMLERGEAPESAYIGIEADENLFRYLARHWSDGYMFAEFRRPGQRGLYVKWNRQLTLKKKFQPIPVEKNSESIKFLPRFFEAPYSGEEFTCGYKMLPMTQKILGRLFANIGLNLETINESDSGEERSLDHDGDHEYDLHENNGDYCNGSKDSYSDDPEIINFDSVEVYSNSESDHF